MILAKNKQIFNIVLTSRGEFRFEEKNIDFVKNYSDDIISISITTYQNFDYSAIHYLTNLNEIAIEVLATDNQELDFIHFPKLEKLTFDWRKKTKNLDKLYNLKELLISKYKKENLSEFSELSKLETLFVWQSSIENLEGGDNLSSVKRLSLYGDRKLTSLKGIEKFKNLTILEIDGCKSIGSINEISSLENLEILKIDNCGDIESLKPIQHLKKLKELSFAESTNILDGDLSPCKGIKSVGFMERKHYTHKYADLNIR
jgi:hypothetical protein